MDCRPIPTNWHPNLCHPIWYHVVVNILTVHMLPYRGWTLGADMFGKGRQDCWQLLAQPTFWPVCCWPVCCRPDATEANITTVSAGSKCFFLCLCAQWLLCNINFRKLTYSMNKCDGICGNDDNQLFAIKKSTKSIDSIICDFVT